LVMRNDPREMATETTMTQHEKSVDGALRGTIERSARKHEGRQDKMTHERLHAALAELGWTEDRRDSGTVFYYSPRDIVERCIQTVPDLPDLACCRERGGGRSECSPEEALAWARKHEAAAGRGARFAFVRILPAPGGFGMWQVEASKSDYSEAHDDEADLVSLLHDVVGDVYELGVDNLPEDLEDREPVRDIRGRIENEPRRVFARIDAGRVTYEGVVEVLPV
jgi:hypothetical protein